MKRFLIALGSLTIIASVAFVIIRMLSKKPAKAEMTSVKPKKMKKAPA